ncbi:hypothetical protein UPYG_G00223870 [Umbra pygmaea]|uniref:KIAA1522 n=1 Tax=Umbra pygmaea TaxID=75934 RepID=A0ABD0WY66_UMBPY
MMDAQYNSMEVGPGWSGMSGRESVGDLIPQDVAEVFAHERHKKGGRRKKRGGSLGRAFNWLKGKRKKDVNANGQSQDFHSGGLKAGKPSPAGHHHAVLKQEDEVAHIPSHYQENVFIEASRPKYLEDLHTEAQEGLKMQLQEETNFGVDYQDNQSVASTVTQQPNDTETETETESYSYRDRRGSMSDSTMADTMSQVSTRSTISTRSTRSGLTRQASTFRPLKSENKPEKAKARRKHRRTVMGIPQHIQRELGLDRAAWAGRQVVDEDGLPNSESQNSHTIDGSHQARSQEGVRLYLQSVEGLQPVVEGQVPKFPSRAGHRDDLALLQLTDPQLAGVNRPKSLAVPWMTTASSLQQHPPSPVMSMNPQAAYMSKIIPNAVLPPSIDVVEISRNRSRSSVRTISKSKLLLASPASSRASSRASAMSSASRYNPSHFSDSSGWSRSDSSETLVSDSSTISSNSTARPEDSQEGEGSVKGRALDGESIHSSVSKASRISAVNLKGKARGHDGRKGQEGPLIRSLSVMKPKKAPPPPSRSYSLHKDKMKRRSREITTDFRVLTPHQSSSAPVSSPSSIPASNTSSPGYTADTSSPDDSPHSVTISPLNTPQQTAREEVRNEQPGSKHPSPQITQENGLTKTVSASSGYSSQGGTPSLYPKQTQNPGNRRGILGKIANMFPRAASPAASSASKTPEPQSSRPAVTPSPSVMALRELFNIPPPPKVSAPPPPPPEVWAHNRRTFELLLGPPAPNNMDTVVRKNPKDRRQQRQCPSTSREGSVRNVSPEPEAGIELDRVRLTKEQLGPADREKELAQIWPSGGVKWNGEVSQKTESERMMVSQLIGKLEEVKASQLGNGKSVTTESQATVATLSMVSQALADVTSSPSSPSQFPPLPPSKQTLIVAPHLMPPDSTVFPEHRLVSPYGEAFWPPPPSPMDLTNLGSELDLPLPPPPSGYEDEVVMTAPVTEQTLKAPNLARSAPQNVPSISQGIPPPPQTIPPPPPQKAPPAPALDITCSTPKQTSPTKAKFCPPFSIPPPPQNSPPPPPINTTQQSKPVTLESQNPENTSLCKSPSTPPEGASSPVVTPSLLQMVKLRSVKHAGQEQAQTEVQEVILRAKKISAASEATPASEAIPAPATEAIPEATPASEATHGPASALEAIPALEVTPSKNESFAIKASPVPSPEAAPAKNQPTHLHLAPMSSVVTSPTRKTLDSGTNNSTRMQEAIRLRTAARSKEGPSSRLSLHSVTSPTGLKSPSSTANFIFAKSTKKVVMEIPSSPESQANLTKNLMAELSSVSNLTKSSDTQNKMPPPVARKPQPKVKDAETGVQTEHVQSAGQEAQPAGAPEAQHAVPISLST